MSLKFFSSVFSFIFLVNALTWLKNINTCKQLPCPKQISILGALQKHSWSQWEYNVAFISQFIYLNHERVVIIGKKTQYNSILLSFLLWDNTSLEGYSAAPVYNGIRNNKHFYNHKLTFKFLVKFTPHSA